MVKKLKRGVLVGKRRGLCTTPPPIWRLELYSEHHCNKPNSEFLNLRTTTTSISARNLCASLWEIESYQCPFAQMSKAAARHRHKHSSSNGAELDTPTGHHYDQVYLICTECLILSLWLFFLFGVCLAMPFCQIQSVWLLLDYTCFVIIVLSPDIEMACVFEVLLPWDCLLYTASQLLHSL